MCGYCKEVPVSGTWYLAVTAYAIGYDLETVLRLNARKLRKRYPDGFDPEKSQNRKKGDI